MVEWKDKCEPWKMCLSAYIDNFREYMNKK
jgi:hypothetical protein